MGFIVNKKFIENVRFRFDDSEDEDEGIMTIELNSIPCSYEINHEIISDVFWKYLKTDLKLKEDDVSVKTFFEIDERKREVKRYKYYVRTEGIYFIFNDEFRQLDDDDFITQVDDIDKKDKIVNLRIYYNSKEIRNVEDNILPKIKEMIHITSIKNQFFIITTGIHGYELRSSFVKDVDIDLELNYGKSFSKTDELILGSIESNKSGLYLLHGPSGTGKTTWIRRLISIFGDKKTIIYMPSFMMYHLADPELISFISRFKNSILILEDAENVLTKSVDERSQAVSNLLNFSDGILGDNLNIQIIATFNVEKKVIDEALLRAGRLRVNYKFKKLTAKQSTELSTKLGLNQKFDTPKTLAEIYEGLNQLIDIDDSDPKKIGFKFNEKE